MHIRIITYREGQNKLNLCTTSAISTFRMLYSIEKMHPYIKVG